MILLSSGIFISDGMASAIAVIIGVGIKIVTKNKNNK
jgi:hypothetical protein